MLKNKIFVSLLVIIFFNVLVLISIFLYFQHQIEQERKQIISKFQTIQSQEDIDSNQSSREDFPRYFFDEDEFFGQLRPPDFFDMDASDFDKYSSYRQQSGSRNINSDRLRYTLKSQNWNLFGEVESNNQEILQKIKDGLEDEWLEVSIDNDLLEFEWDIVLWEEVLNIIVQTELGEPTKDPYRDETTF